MRTLDRYVIREILPPFFLSLLVFTFILEIPPVMRDLERLVAKGVSWGTAAMIILTLVPQGLGLTIPMATLTGILIGLGRLSGDREAVALLACGVSPYRMLRPVLVFAIATTAATLYVMLQAIPDANQIFREITFDLVSKKVASDIRPRVFFEEFPGFVLYVRDEMPEGAGWKDVLVADSSKPESTTVYMANSGRVVIDRKRQTVQLHLENGVQYSSGKPGQSGLYEFPKEITVPLDPKTVFQRQELPRTVTEKSIGELAADADRKLYKEGYSPHPEIMYTQQKFSIPAACLVFAVIGLALGLTSARDTKMAGFVIGLVVVFVYYAILEVGAAQTRGHYREIEEAARQAKNPTILIEANWMFAYLARWWPNIILGAFGIGALVWRARYAQRGLPVTIPVRVPQLPSRWQRHGDVTPQPASPPPATTAPAARRGRVVIVVRIPRLRIPGGMGVLDRYVSKLYLRIFALSFVGLLSLFYISTFVDKAEKVFKGDATTGQVLAFMAYSTPEFVYFVIPLAVLMGVLVTFGFLSRTSELTVTKACGISLYRTALPVIGLSFVASGALFALEQQVLAQSLRKAKAIDNEIRKLPVQNFNPINRRWIVARNGAIYHYTFFDPQQQLLSSLSVYKPEATAWRLATQAFASTASYRNGWTANKGWERDFTKNPPAYREFDQRPFDLEPPDYFGTETPIAQFMTVPELRKHIADLRASGFAWTSLAVELQRKIAFPFVTVVMTLLAVPFGVTTGRRGALYGIGIGIAIALAYWILLHVFLAIGSAGLLPPFLAGWSANIIVAGAAAFLLLNTRT
jgi:lipopolysaccharide export system permease protein